MSLCEACRSITFQKLRSLPNFSLLDDQPSPQETRLVHLQRACDLPKSAQGCPLCAMIEEVLSLEASSEQSGSVAAGIQPTVAQHDGGAKIQSLTTDPLEIAPRLDSLGTAFPNSSVRGVQLRGFMVIGRRDNGLVKGPVRLYLKDDTAMLDGMIVGRQPLQDSGSGEAFDLVKKWLKACRDDHVKCRSTISGGMVDETTPPELPTRVIDVGSIDGTHPPRLIVPNGVKARYVALSHCWGPPEQPPLRTTRSNLNDLLQLINWTNLPKTFQDAITTVRQIGIRYIWIDSLCIVQDDQQEWLRESVKMGSIYERAEFTIAASHSPDSWQGLFLPRPELPVVELPHFLEGQNISTQVFATIRREQRDDTFPEHGHLSKRAWATQEWLLSRRIVFYTNGQIIWSCKTLTQRETGEKFYCTARNTRWKDIIELYSERLLTHPTDRLIALEGLKTEFEKKTGDSYRHGLWKNSLPDQLLWQVTRKVLQPRNPLQLPSWTWASIPCGIRFLRIDGAKSLCASIKHHGHRELIINAMLKQVEVLRENDTLQRTPSIITRDIQNSNAKQTVFLHLTLYTANGDHIGWLVFDLWVEKLASKSLFCLALMGSLSRRDEAKERRTGITVSSKPREYWVLVLEPYKGTAYRRVGVGKIYRKEWWQDAPVQDVTLF